MDGTNEPTIERIDEWTKWNRKGKRVFFSNSFDMAYNEKLEKFDFISNQLIQKKYTEAIF